MPPDAMTAEVITLLLGFLALVGGQIASVLTLVVRMDRQARQINERIDRQAEQTAKRLDDVNKRFDDVNKRFDDMIREFADLRERMAKLEGSLEGFVAGRRDRDAA